MTNQAYIYYGQYRGISLMSWYIRFFNWGPDSHTSCFYPPDKDGNFNEVIEAWRKGVTRNHWRDHHTKGTRIDVFRIPVTAGQADIYYRRMESLIGKKYDFLGVIGFRVRLDIESPRRWFCSESDFWAMLMAGVVPLARIKPHRVYPSLMRLIPTAELVATLTV